MDKRFNALRAEMDERFASVDERFEALRVEMNRNFDVLYGRMLSIVRWTVGTLALFGTLITILLTVGQFVK